MSDCEFCKKAVGRVSYTLAESDVSWMASALHAKWNLSHQTHEFNRPSLFDIRYTLREYKFCSGDCAKAAGAEAALGESI